MTYKKLIGYSLTKLARIPSKLGLLDQICIASLILLCMAIANNGGLS